MMFERHLLHHFHEALEWYKNFNRHLPFNCSHPHWHQNVPQLSEYIKYCLYHNVFTWPLRLYAFIEPLLPTVPNTHRFFYWLVCCVQLLYITRQPCKISLSKGNWQSLRNHEVGNMKFIWQRMKILKFKDLTNQLAKQCTFMMFKP